MEEREKLRAKWRDKDEDGDSSHGFPANPSEMEAAMVCIQALYRSGIEEEVRSQVIGKFFEGTRFGQFKSKQQELMDMEHSSKPHGKSSDGFEQTGMVGNEGPQSQAEEELEKFISSFLCKAVSNGALELKDTGSLSRCLEETKRDKTRGNVESNLHASHNASKMLHNDSSQGGHGNGSFSGAGKMQYCLREGEKLNGPPDNNPPVFTQRADPYEATAPYAATAHSTCQHVIQNKGEVSLDPKTDGRVPQGMHLPQAKSNPTFLEIASSKSDGLFPSSVENNKNKDSTHVNSTPKSHVYLEKSTPKPLTFLEAAKLSLKKPTENASQQDIEIEGNFSNSPYFSSNGSPIFKIDQGVLHKRMEMCRFSVLAKVTLAKGDEPWTWVKLKEKLDVLWELKSQWRLISLGKGFFHIILPNQEEHERVWSKEVLHLKPGILRLQRWTFGFDPSSEKNTKAQIWFRIHHLPWCLWDASVISGIARKIGEPLRIDRTTLEGSFGHYARVLVEVDLSKPIMSSILVDCNSHVFEVKLSPESLPHFCKGCNSIGHTANDCRMLLKKDVNSAPYMPTNENRKFYTGNRGEEQEMRKDEFIGVSHNLFARASSTDFKASKRSAQQTEWRKKKVHVIGKDRAHKTDNSGQKQVRTIVETVTDFSAQVGAQASRDSRADSLVISNQFAPLETGEEAEEIPPSSKKDDNQRMDFNCIESFAQPDEDEEVILPKIPKKWSDILDEEEKEEVPLFLEMDFPVKEKAMPFHPYYDSNPPEEYVTRRTISEIRQGLQEMTEKNAHLLHTKISSKKDNKLKLGFRQPKGPICSSKR